MLPNYRITEIVIKLPCCKNCNARKLEKKFERFYERVYYIYIYNIINTPPVLIDRLKVHIFRHKIRDYNNIMKNGAAFAGTISAPCGRDRRRKATEKCSTKKNIIILPSDEVADV